MDNGIVTMAHGSGGAESAALVQRVFLKHFDGEALARLDDSTVVSLTVPMQNVISSKASDTFVIETPSDHAVTATPSDHAVTATPSDHAVTATPSSARGKQSTNLAISTDTYVVEPLVFPGGDIGKLAVCGTVNDVLMSGAKPLWLTCGFILETGLSIELLDSICASMAAAAKEAGVTIVAGDTKVIVGQSSGLMINTTGIGVLPCVSPSGIRPGDAIIVSGNLGEHHAAVMSARMGVKNDIKSDCALITPIVHALQCAGIPIHAMRDVTRGGLGTILNELASSSGVSIVIEEDRIPVSREVRAFCGLMGLDPIYMGNEGKMALAVRQEDAERTLALMHGTEVGKNSAIIGKALSGSDEDPATQTLEKYPPVAMKTQIGGTSRIDVLYGEGLPRIC